MQARLPDAPTLTLEAAVTIALAMESANRDASVLEGAAAFSTASDDAVSVPQKKHLSRC